MPAKKQRKKCAPGKRRNPDTGRCKKVPARQKKGSWAHNQKTGEPRKVCVVYKRGPDGKALKGKGACRINTPYPGKARYAQYKKEMEKAKFDAKSPLDDTTLAASLYAIFQKVGLAKPLKIKEAPAKKIPGAAPKVKPLPNKPTAKVSGGGAAMELDNDIAQNESLVRQKISEEAQAIIESNNLIARKAVEEAHAVVERLGRENALLRLEGEALAVAASMTAAELHDANQKLILEGTDLAARATYALQNMQDQIAGGTQRERALMTRAETSETQAMITRMQQEQKAEKTYERISNTNLNMTVEENNTLIGNVEMSLSEASAVREHALTTSPTVKEILDTLDERGKAEITEIDAEEVELLKLEEPFPVVVRTIKQSERNMIYSKRTLRKLFSYFNDVRQFLNMNRVTPLPMDSGMSELYDITRGMIISTIDDIENLAAGYIAMTRGATQMKTTAFRLRIIYSKLGSLLSVK